MLTVDKSNYSSDIEELKKEYIQSLDGPLESSIEELIEYDSETLLLKYENKIIGYCCIDKKRTIQQLYLIDDYIKFGSSVLDLLIKEQNARDALVNTRDRLFISICLEKQREIEINAYLFEDTKRVKTQLLNFEKLDFRLATLKDMSLIKDVCGCFYDYLHYTLEESIKRSEIFVLYANEILLGTGSVVTKNCNPPYAEIGMCVNKLYYKNNIGTYVITKLKEYCYNNKLIPICNCSYKNIASKRTLEKSGFISKDRIFKITF